MAVDEFNWLSRLSVSPDPLDPLGNGEVGAARLDKKET